MSHTTSRIGGQLLLALCLSGCALTIEPAVTESNAVFDPRLLGAWRETSGADRAVVSRGNGNTYAVAYSDGDVSGTFAARLGRVGDRLVLDVWPNPKDKEVAEPYSGVLIVGHSLLSVEIGADELRLAGLERKALRAAIDAGQVRLTYSGSDNERLVLHGSTEALNAALASYVARPGAWEAPDVWRRVP